MKKYLIILVALLSATATMAKDITPAQERAFYRKAYDLIRNYAKVSQISDDRTATLFYDLFESPHLRIANDLMSLSPKTDLSVSEYIDLLKNADMVTVGVSDVKKNGEIYEDDGFLKLNLTFSKSISFVSPCNSYFDSKDFFGKDYNMGMTIVYDPSTGEYKISELKFYEPYLKFPQDYRVLVKYDSRDNNLDINGKYVNFQMDQKVLRPTDQLYYRGAKVQEKDIEGQCDHKVYAYYNDKSWRIRLNGGYAVEVFNKLGDESNDLNVTNTGEMSFGLDFGYVFPTTSHLRFGVFAGVGFSSSNVELKMEHQGEYLLPDCNQDVDRNMYDRIYEGEGDNMKITQKMNTTDLCVPLYLDMEYEFNSIFSIYTDAGVKFMLPMSNSTKVTNNALIISGLYKDYKDPAGKDLVINQYINNFGPNKENCLVPDSEAAKNNFVIGGILGVGARVNISKSIALDAGVQYQQNFLKNWEGTDKNANIFNYRLPENPDPANPFNDGVDYVNLMSKARSLSLSPLKVNISLIYKF